MLHARVYFRSLHLGNVVRTPEGRMGLIDIADLRVSARRSAPPSAFAISSTCCATNRIEPGSSTTASTWCSRPISAAARSTGHSSSSSSNCNWIEQGMFAATRLTRSPRYQPHPQPLDPAAGLAGPAHRNVLGRRPFRLSPAFLYLAGCTDAAVRDTATASASPANGLAAVHRLPRLQQLHDAEPVLVDPENSTGSLLKRPCTSPSCSSAPPSWRSKLPSASRPRPGWLPLAR